MSALPSLDDLLMLPAAGMGKNLLLPARRLAGGPALWSGDPDLDGNLLRLADDAQEALRLRRPRQTRLPAGGQTRQDALQSTRTVSGPPALFQTSAPAVARPGLPAAPPQRRQRERLDPEDPETYEALKPEIGRIAETSSHWSEFFGHLQKVLDVVDLPRMVVAKVLNLVIGAQASSPDPSIIGGDRIYGADVMRRFGIKNRTGQLLGGFLWDVATDPLTYATGLGAVLRAAGKVSIGGITRTLGGGLARAVNEQALQKGAGTAIRTLAERAGMTGVLHTLEPVKAVVQAAGMGDDLACVLAKAIPAAGEELVDVAARTKFLAPEIAQVVENALNAAAKNPQTAGLVGQAFAHIVDVGKLARKGLRVSTEPLRQFPLLGKAVRRVLPLAETAELLAPGALAAAPRVTGALAGAAVGGVAGEFVDHPVAGALAGAAAGAILGPRVLPKLAEIGAPLRQAMRAAFAHTPETEIEALGKQFQRTIRQAERLTANELAQWRVTHLEDFRKIMEGLAGGPVTPEQASNLYDIALEVGAKRPDDAFRYFMEVLSGREIPGPIQAEALAGQFHKLRTAAKETVRWASPSFEASETTHLVFPREGAPTLAFARSEAGPLVQHSTGTLDEVLRAIEVEGGKPSILQRLPDGRWVATDIATRPRPDLGLAGVAPTAESAAARRTEIEARQAAQDALARANAEAARQTRLTAGQRVERAILERVQATGAQVSPGEFAGVVALTKARAAALGKSADEYLARLFVDVRPGETLTPEQITKFGLTQTATGEVLTPRGLPPKGFVDFLEENRRVLYLFKTADVSTLIHETGHVWRRELVGLDLAAVEAWAGVVGGKWTRAPEEKFSRALERYVRDGIAPTRGLRRIFARFKAWMSRIYATLAGTPIENEIPGDVREVLDRMFLAPGEELTEAAKYAQKVTAHERLETYIRARNYFLPGQEPRRKTAAVKAVLARMEADDDYKRLLRAARAERTLEGKEFVAETRQAAAASLAAGEISEDTLIHTPVEAWPEDIRTEIAFYAKTLRADPLTGAAGYKGLDALIAGKGSGGAVEDQASRIMRIVREGQTGYYPDRPLYGTPPDEALAARIAGEIDADALAAARKTQAAGEKWTPPAAAGAETEMPFQEGPPPFQEAERTGAVGPEGPMSEALRALHDSPVRRLGITVASDRQIEQYFDGLRRLASKVKRTDLADFIDEAEQAWLHGDYGLAVQDSERALGYLHMDERYELQWAKEQLERIRGLPEELAKTKAFKGTLFQQAAAATFADPPPADLAFHDLLVQQQMPDEIAAIVSRDRDRENLGLLAMRATGADVKTLKSDRVAHAFHQTEVQEGLWRSFKRLWFNRKAGFQHKRLVALRDKSIYEVNALMKARNAPDLFRTDPVAWQTAYEMSKDRLLGGALFLQEVGRRFGAPAAKAPDGYQVFRGASNLLKIVDGLAFPPEVTDYLTRYDQMWQAPGEFLKVYDQLMGTLKGWMLVAPAYHIRNLASNVWQSMSGEGFSLPGYTAGFKAMRADIRGDATALARVIEGTKNAATGGKAYTAGELVDALKQDLLSGHGFFAAEGGELARRVLGASLEEPTAIQKVVDLARRFPRYNQIVGAALEDSSKVGHVITRLRAGDTLEQAIASARKFLFDYADLTPFERNTMRRIFPFYSWARHNLALQIQMLFERPEITALFPKIKGNIEGSLPEGQVVPMALRPDYVRREAGIQLGGGLKPSYMNLANILPLGELGYLTPRGALTKALDLLNPMVKTPIELAVNRDFFFNRPIRNFPGETVRVAGVPVSPEVAKLAGPLRPLSEIDRILYGLQRGEAPGTIAGRVAGMRTFTGNLPREIASYERRQAETRGFMRAKIRIALANQDVAMAEQVAAIQEQLGLPEEALKSHIAIAEAGGDYNTAQQLALDLADMKRKRTSGGGPTATQVRELGTELATAQ